MEIEVRRKYVLGGQNVGRNINFRYLINNYNTLQKMYVSLRLRHYLLIPLYKLSLKQSYP